MTKEYKPSFERVNFPNEKVLKASLKKLSKSGCHRCLGRGHTGWDILKKHWRVCLCVDTNVLKEVGDRLCKLAETKEGVEN